MHLPKLVTVDYSFSCLIFSRTVFNYNCCDNYKLYKFLTIISDL